MLFIDNLSNRELLSNAMPLKSLSREQWNSVLQFYSKYLDTNNNTLLNAVHTLITNQSRIEVISKYNECYMNEIDDFVKEESEQLFI